MERLKNKKYKQSDYVCRYSPFPYFFNTLDDKFVYGVTAKIDKNISYVEHKVREEDTLDSLALIYYGRPDYFWIIADYNDIQDPYAPLFNKYKSLKIPTFSAIKYVK